MTEVKLLGVGGSSYSRRVEWALKVKGVKYEFVEEDLQNKSPLLLESNPVLKKIPVLIHNGKPIRESMIILEYIDEAFEGPSILPKDPYERAIARFWAKFLDGKCLDAVREALWSKFGGEQEKIKQEAYEMLKIVDNELKGKKFFGGNKIGFVDVAANYIPFWVEIVEEASGNVLITSEKFPNLCAWMDEYLSCSEVKENLPDRDFMLSFFKAKALAENIIS
ncbi:putative glutathione S-transferase [Capsicum annuum]|uniref:probable glutathione S-transferase n=1 Tax=Capsicum annuum TaxID=4072 RepID=UPI0007BFE8C2|nr:probable glutathione S-transferase [Capsicum annuum]KAF3627586.1 putative glutathione S-transferase [Capsicum annuum]KAF3637185.1 putative glutathione S-transferase [Capsicum annuum]